MPTITYDTTASATESEMDDLEAAAKNWADGVDKVLHNLDKRYDVDALAITLSWEVAAGDVDETIANLDTAIEGLSIDLPLASDVATVEYP